MTTGENITNDFRYLQNLDIIYCHIFEELLYCLFGWCFCLLVRCISISCFGASWILNVFIFQTLRRSNMSVPKEHKISGKPSSKKSQISPSKSPHSHLSVQNIPFILGSGKDIVQIPLYKCPPRDSSAKYRTIVSDCQILTPLNTDHNATNQAFT